MPIWSFKLDYMLMINTVVFFTPVKRYMRLWDGFYFLQATIGYHVSTLLLCVSAFVSELAIKTLGFSKVV